MISGVVSGALVSIASWVLTGAGYLFDLAVSKTILDFGSFANPNVIAGINIAWTVGRDISNIIIIGLFTFIAIATILGNTEYGVRRMLSHVLIVAVLINFSLLFTKIIIDVSNFTAVQFYAGAQSVIGQPAGASNVSPGSANTVQTAGISGAFMQYAGVSGFGDTYKAVGELAKKQNSWVALIYGIATAFFLVVAAIVLLYGTFLLITRALVLLFLMITAALAFASYLWPKLSEGGYGWNTWWNALLKNAVFAPLLIFFLWVTLTLGKAFSKSSGSLGQLIIDPQSSMNISALFGYVIVIGLLFASFKLSSSFASSVGGLNLSQYAFDLGRSRLGGFAWQQTLGRFAYNRERAATTNARMASRQAEDIRRHAETTGTLTNLDKKSLKALDQKAATNPRRANTFGTLANKQIGGVQGYAGGIGKAPSAVREVKGAQARAAGTPEKQSTPAQAQQTPQMDELLKQQRDANARIESNGKTLAESIKTLAETNREAAEAHKTIESNADERKNIELKHSEENLRKQIESAVSGAANPEEQKEIEQQIRNTSSEQRASELRHQNERIERAQTQLASITANNPEVATLLQRIDEVKRSITADQAILKESSEAMAIVQQQNNAPMASGIASSSPREDLLRATRAHAIRAEFRPHSTDVAAHAEVTVQDKPAPIQQKAA